MDQAAFAQIEAYMLDCMKDSAHDREHVYRVLYYALDIAGHESGAGMDVLVAACLLHDIGRAEQYRNPERGHERVGGRMAYGFLRGMHWPEADAAHVRDCVYTHRFRSDAPPASPEAKILFDADKLDAAGTLGIARTLLYQGAVSEPLYSPDAHGGVSDGAADSAPSFFREYRYKLEKLYAGFYTQRARQIANAKRPAAEAFYEEMLSEARACYANGRRALAEVIR